MVLDGTCNADHMKDAAARPKRRSERQPDSRRLGWKVVLIAPADLQIFSRWKMSAFGNGARWKVGLAQNNGGMPPVMHDKNLFDVFAGVVRFRFHYRRRAAEG